MFIFKLTYLQSIEEVEKYLPAHLAYLQEYYDTGYFIASGRQVPRVGGIILCRASSKDAAEAILQEDPFYIHQVAEYEVIEFVPSKYVNGFEAFI
ncbi:GTP cyclohydrolase [Snodgrassella alvi]|uniref:GTP cyclohydrolase n=1 Tax=Snodgrassella alvi TaxID=1196083 RepID=A0A2N9WWE3_9NEIS|nr:YciI family protein [Snodgrassella alvi]PIT18298.1 GTP cyclohydrolase [Snodgrassella alvi]